MNSATPQFSPGPDPQERDWQVFRYVAGEMSELEQREFEDLLFEDQTLREAVAEMVCLTRSVSLSLAVPEPVARPAVAPARARRRQLVWGSLTVAALAVAFYIGWTARPLSPPSEIAQPDPAPESRPVHSDAHVLALVSHWSAGETLVNPEGGTLTEAGQLLADTDLSLDEAAPGDAADADSLNVPEWMLLAVNPAANSAEMEEN